MQNSGGVLPGGSSKLHPTGDWKTQKPVRDRTKCVHCLTCYNYCPDACWKIKGGKLDDSIDYGFCKGCGICAEVCPVKCIQMKPINE